MKLAKLRLYAAGLLAFLLGIPLTERAFGQGDDVVNASFNLAAAIADSVGQS